MNENEKFENVVENDNINEGFEVETNNDTEFNTNDDEDCGVNPVGLFVGIVGIVAGVSAAVTLAYKGGKFVCKKIKAKAKAKLIEELKAEGWVNPNEETETDAAEEDDTNEE